MELLSESINWIIQSTTIYLPIAGIQFNIIILVTIGFCVGILGGFFGVGGAWIVTPALIIFKMPAPFAIGTDLAHIMGKSIISTRKHWEMGNVDWKLGLISNIGTVAGVELGAQLIVILKNMGGDVVGTSVRYTYIVLLIGMGAFMLYDYFVIRKRKEAGIRELHKGSKNVIQRIRAVNIPPFMGFPKSGIDRISVWVIVFIFFFTGFLSGFLGVGGGFIRMPALIYLLGCPTAIAVGTDLFIVLLDGAYGCFTYGMKGTVEIVAALFLLLGAAAGAQIGVAAVKYIKGYGIRLLFAVMILLAGASVILNQIYHETGIVAIDTASAIVIMGSALVMSGIIFVKLVKGFRKEKRAAERL